MSNSDLPGLAAAWSPPLLDFQEHVAFYGSTTSMKKLAVRSCRYPGNVANHRARPHKTNADPPHTTTTAARYGHENAPIVAVSPQSQSLSCYQPVALQMEDVVLYMLQEAAMLDARAALCVCPLWRLLCQAPLWRICLLVTMVPNAFDSNMGCHPIGHDAWICDWASIQRSSIFVWSLRDTTCGLGADGGRWCRSRV